MNRKSLAILASLAVLSVSSIAVAAAQGHARSGGQNPERPAPEARDRAQFRRGMFGLRGGGGEQGHMGPRERLTRRRELIGQHVREHLGITEAQREQFRAQAKAVAPVREQLRSEARAILERTHEAVRNGGDRAALREQARSELRSLFQRALPQLRPSARAIIDQLTPEQRAKLEAAAARRGKTLDQERLERGAATLLMRRARPEAQHAQR